MLLLSQHAREVLLVARTSGVALLVGACEDGKPDQVATAIAVIVRNGAGKKGRYFGKARQAVARLRDKATDPEIIKILDEAFKALRVNNPVRSSKPPKFKGRTPARLRSAA